MVSVEKQQLLIFAVPSAASVAPIVNKSTEKILLKSFTLSCFRLKIKSRYTCGRSGVSGNSKCYLPLSL